MSEAKSDDEMSHQRLFDELQSKLHVRCVRRALDNSVPLAERLRYWESEERRLPNSEIAAVKALRYLLLRAATELDGLP